jgi:hypothetical protein
MSKNQTNYFYRNTFLRPYKMGAKQMMTFLKLLPTKAQIFFTDIDPLWKMFLDQDHQLSAFGFRKKCIKILRSEKIHAETLLNF